MARSSPKSSEDDIVNTSPSSATRHPSPSSEISQPASNDHEGPAFRTSEVLYSLHAFDAVARPVFITIVLAAASTNYIQTESSRTSGESALGAYITFQIPEDDTQTNSARLGYGVLNSLIIVSFIGGMTYGIVLLYKYRCMKFLNGYMALSTTMLFGFMGGNIFLVAIDRYSINIDWITFFWVVFNFTVTGTAAVFYKRGIPSYIEQSYLVAISVILSWQLAHFEEWICWALLVMLALYDLCAVLTPCGPLKALVNLMQKDGAAPMPGLLYEANLPVSRPARDENNRGERDANTQERSSSAAARAGQESSREAQRNPKVSRRSRSEEAKSVSEDSSSVEEDDECVAINVSRSRSPPLPQPSKTSSVGRYKSPPTVPSRSSATTPGELPVLSIARIPYAIARVYRLSLAPSAYRRLDPLTGHINENPRPASLCSLAEDGGLGADAAARLLDGGVPSVEDLHTFVEVIMPNNRSRFETERGDDGTLRHMLIDKHGTVKRVLVVNPSGQVFEETESDDDDSETDEEGGSIKLGLVSAILL
mmetsp:Transcript_32888/g.75693  ORF Transcript_32888/g.75693 Transcript_32888/m.75693 type:complete len:537 (-) Transcript_32888:228-1838(-)